MPTVWLLHRAQLTGLPVRFTNSNVTAMWDLFEEDPLPPAQHPTKGNNNRRFFCYSTAIKALGGTMTRVKLPDCVELHVEELYPRPSMEPPVGFQAH